MGKRCWGKTSVECRDDETEKPLDAEETLMSTAENWETEKET
jgi:hypothetical protein